MDHAASCVPPQRDRSVAKGTVRLLFPLLYALGMHVLSRHMARSQQPPAIDGRRVNSHGLAPDVCRSHSEDGGCDKRSNQWRLC